MPAPQYKRPESVLVLVHSADGLVLLLRRTEPAGFWQSVTGGLRWEESAAQAAARELREETGLEARPEDCGRGCRFPIWRRWRARYPPDADWNTEHWFRLRLAQQCPVRLSPHEHSEYLWLPAAEARVLVTSWTNRAAIESCLAEHLP